MAVKLGNGKWAVKENNLLAYNDNSGQFFNKEFDFTRGSSATYVGKDGLIKTAGLQDTNLVQNGDFSELGSELVTNGDFATDSNWIKQTGWSISNGVANSDGSQTSNSNLLQNIGVLTVGKTFKMSYKVSNYSAGVAFIGVGGYNYAAQDIEQNGEFTQYLLVTNSSSNTNFYITANRDFVGSIDNVSIKQVDPNDEWTLGSGWSYGDGKAISTNSTNSNLENVSISIANGKQYKFTFEITDFTGNGFVRPQLGAVGAVIGTYVQGNGVYSQILIANNNFDRIVLRTGGGNGFNGSVSNISVQEVQVNTPRIDFSDSADGALLLEPQSTNLINYSEDFSDISWTLFGTIQANSSVSPNGLTTATKLTHTHSQYNMLRVIAGGVRTTSVFVKNVDADNFYIRGSSSGSGYAYYNFNTKTVNINSLKVEYFANDWIRLSLTDSITLRQFGVGVNETDSSESGNSVYVWGAQLEESSYPTSYIPTQGSTSTRIAETCTNSGSAQDFNSEEGVLYAEISALSDVTSLNFLSLSDGTINNRVTIGLDNNNYNCQVRKEGTAVFDISGILTNVKLFNKIAVSYAENNFSLWINGTKVATDTSGLTPIGLNQLDFNLPERPYDFYGKFKSVEVFTESLSDEKLQKLTTI